MIVEIESHQLMELLWMARRYADKRSTYCPSLFNMTYEAIKQLNPDLIKKERVDDVCEYFPYAQDGMYDPKTGDFDARPNP